MNPEVRSNAGMLNPPVIFRMRSQTSGIWSDRLGIMEDLSMELLYRIVEREELK